MTLLSNMSPSPISDFNLSDYYLIDVSLLDNQGDLVDINNEFWTFSLDPSEVYTFQPGITWPNAWPPYSTIQNWDPTTIYGTNVLASAIESPLAGLVWWPVQSCLVGQCQDSVESGYYDFVGLIDYLNGLLTSPSPSSNFSPPGPAATVIYFPLQLRRQSNRCGQCRLLPEVRSYFFPVSPPGQGMTLVEAFNNADSIGPQQSPGSGDDALVLAYCNYIYSSPPSTTANLPQCEYPPPEIFK